MNILNLLKNNVFLVLLCLSFAGLVSGCKRASTQPPPMPDSPFQTDARHYERDQIRESMSGTIKNGSSSTIEVASLDEFFVYAYDLRQGWVSISRCGRCVNPPEIYLPFTIEPGQTVPVDLWWVVANYSGLCNDSIFIIGANYKLLSDEGNAEKTYVMYSNEFRVGNPRDAPLWVQITNLEFSIPAIEISSEYSSTWIRPLCSSLLTQSEQIGVVASPGEYPHATLQRRTAWGTWEVIQPKRSDCAEMIAPIEISGPTAQTVELWEGLDFDWEALEPGWYRWHVVYFRNGPEGGFSSDYHWFTEEFRIGE